MILRRDNAEFGLKVIGVLIALFGVWKYFDTQKQEMINSAKARSLSYIERFGSAEVVAPRGTLLTFWQDHPGASVAIRDNLMTPRGYRLFVAAAYPNSARKEETDEALFRLSVFFNELSHCRSSGICNKDMLDSFFCDYVKRFVPAYLPFYQLISEETGSEMLISSMQSFARDCEALSSTALDQ